MTIRNTRSSARLKSLLAGSALAAGIVAAAHPAYAVDDYAVWNVDHYESGTSASITAQSQGYVQFTGNTSTVIAVLGQKNIGQLGHVDINANLWVAKGQGADPMQILGHLSSTGRIVVIDQNGVFFGPGSRVDTAGIIATTGTIDNGQLLNKPFGQYTIENAGNGKIELHGLMNVADAGLAAFVAPTVINNGIINARLGKVAFGAGEKVTLDLYGDNLMEIAVDDKVADALLENTGTISAEGGVIQMTAQAAKEAVDDVINMAGIATVASVTQQGDKIILSGGNSGKVKVGGTLDASGKNGGGKIDVKGEEIEVAPDAFLMADAIEQGDGGNITVFADNNAIFRGRAYARGGDLGGNGGFIEVSAKNELGYDGRVNTSATAGTAGTFLLDPLYALIHSGTLDYSGPLTRFISADALSDDLGHNGLVLVQAGLAIDVGSDISLLGVGAGTVDVSTYSTTSKIIDHYEPTDSVPGDKNYAGRYGACNSGTPGKNCAPAYSEITVDALTNGTLKLQSNLVNFNTDLIMGAGNVEVDAPTINLDGVLLGRAAVGGPTAELGALRLNGNADTVNVQSNDARIQQGVYLAAAGATVNVAAGTYIEQVQIDKNLTLNGANAGVTGDDAGRGAETVIQAPVSMSGNFLSPSNNRAVVMVTDAGNVVIDGITVDGAHTGSTNDRLIGIGYFNAGGAIRNSVVHGITDSTFNGNQRGNAIYALDTTGVLRTLNVTDNYVYDFQKNGITLNGVGLSGTVSGNVVEGAGATALIAQNGIQIGTGARATVSGNTISGISYTPRTWAASDILLYAAGAGTIVSGNTIHGAGDDIGIYAYNTGNVRIEDNTIDGASWYGVVLDGLNGGTVDNNSIDGAEYGVDVYNVVDGTITNNTISHAIDGIGITGGKGFLLENNTLTDLSDDGIEITNVGGPVNIVGNTIRNTDWNNINLVGAINTYLNQNTLENSVSASGLGVWQGSTGTYLYDNTITGSQYGIWSQGGTINVRNNTISDNAVDNLYLTGMTGATVRNNFLHDAGRAGLYVDGGATGVTAFDNSFEGNQWNVVNTTGTSVDASGNWWGSNSEAAIIAKTSGLVDVTPYQYAGTDTSATEGYQGSFNELGVTAQGSQNGATGRVQEGINLLTAGGTVHVNAGTYTENILIDKSLKLHGLAGATLQAATGGNLITVTADDVNIDPFVFDGLGIAAYGVNAANVANLTIDGNTFQNFTQDAIHLDTIVNADVTGNTVNNVGGYGIYIRNSDLATIDYNNVNNAALDGIKVSGGNGVVVDHNKVANIGRVGIYAEHATNLTFSNNTVTNTTFAIGSPYGGITTDWGSNITITGNNVSQSGHGIMMYDVGGTNKVAGNTVNNVTNDGVNANQVAGLTVSGNTVSNATNGVVANATNGLKVLGNDLTGKNSSTGTGVKVTNSSTVQIGDYNSKHWVQTGKSFWQGHFETTVNANDISSYGTGISITGGTGNDVVNNTAANVHYGVKLSGTTNAEIEGNDLDGNSVTGITVAGGSHGATIQNNDIDHFATGILVENSDDVLVGGSNLPGHNGNTVTNVVNGIVANNAQRIAIYGNSLSNGTAGGNGSGIAITGSHDADIGDDSLLGLFKSNLINGFRDGIQSNNSNNATIAKNTVKNTRRDGIRVDGGDNVNVLVNNVQNVSDTGIWLNRTTNTTAAYNHIDGTTRYSGIRAEGKGSHDVTITHNLIEGTGSNGIAAVGVGRLRITDNVVKDTGTNGVNVDGSDDAVIDGNLIGTLGGAGNIGADGILVKNSVGVQITDNKVSHTASHATNAGNGISLMNADAATVTGNIVYDAAWDGIRVDGGDLNVNRNIVGYTGGNGITVYAYNADILGNAIAHTGGHGIDGSAAYLTIRFNDVDHTGYNGIDADAYDARVSFNTVHDAGWNGINVDADYANIIGNIVTETGDNGITGYGSFVRVNGNNVQFTGDDGIYAGNIGNGDYYGEDYDSKLSLFVSEESEGEGESDDSSEANLIISNNIVLRAGLYGASEGGEGPVDTFLFKEEGPYEPQGDGIEVENASSTLITHNYVNETAKDGIYVHGYQSRGGEGKSQLLVFDPYFSGGTNVIISENLVQNAGQDGIDVTNVNSALVDTNRILYSGVNGFRAGGIDNGVVVLVGNTLTDNPVGMRFESGLIDLTGETNTIEGGAVGLQFDPLYQMGEWVYVPNEECGECYGSYEYQLTDAYAPLSLVNDTIGTTTFTGQSTFYVELRNRALFDPGRPTIINGLNATYDGFRPSTVGGILTQAQYNKLESMIYHYNDENTLGLFFFGIVPFDIQQERLFNRFTNFSGAPGQFSITLTGLPLLNAQGRGSNIASLLNAISPAAGGNDDDEGNGTDYAGNTAEVLAALEPAAGSKPPASPAPKHKKTPAIVRGFFFIRIAGV